MAAIIYPTTEPRFYDTRKITRDKILQAIRSGAGAGGGSGGGSGSSPYTAQMLVDFESGINGATIDATYMNANDKGTPPAAWTITGTAPTVSTANARQLITPVTVEAVTYDTVGGTRSASFTHATAGETLFQFGEPRLNDVTIACWWKDTMPEPDGLNGTYDFLILGNEHDGTAGWGVFQMQAWTAWAHANGVGAGGSGKGGPIAGLHRDTWYWVVLKNKANDGAYLSIYTEAGVLLGTSFCPNDTNNGSVRHVEFGNPVPHGAFPTGAVFIDNVVILWGASAGASSPYPVGP